MDNDKRWRGESNNRTTATRTRTTNKQCNIFFPGRQLVVSDVEEVQTKHKNKNRMARLK
jgi:hypothetical protein